MFYRDMGGSTLYLHPARFSPTSKDHTKRWAVNAEQPTSVEAHKSGRRNTVMQICQVTTKRIKGAAMSPAREQAYGLRHTLQCCAEAMTLIKERLAAGHVINVLFLP